MPEIEVAAVDGSDAVATAGAAEAAITPDIEVAAVDGSDAVATAGAVEASSSSIVASSGLAAAMPYSALYGSSSSSNLRARASSPFCFFDAKIASFFCAS